MLLLGAFRSLTWAWDSANSEAGWAHRVGHLQRTLLSPLHVYKPGALTPPGQLTEQTAPPLERFSPNTQSGIGNGSPWCSSVDLCCLAVAVTCLHVVRMEQMGLGLKWRSGSADDTCAPRVLFALLELRVPAHTHTLKPWCRRRLGQPRPRECVTSAYLNKWWLAFVLAWHYWTHTLVVLISKFLLAVSVITGPVIFFNSCVLQFQQFLRR